MISDNSCGQNICCMKNENRKHGMTLDNQPERNICDINFLTLKTNNYAGLNK